jgi:hypothetical protein
MSRKTKHGMRTASMFMAVLLVACASSEQIRQAPLYAVRADIDSFRVTCLESSARALYVRYDAVDTFYHADGSEKTREEFCQESSFGSINR